MTPIAAAGLDFESRGVERACELEAGEVLLLSTSLLTDRMLFHSRVVDRLEQSRRVRIWTTAARDGATGSGSAEVESFPRILPYREFPYNYLRRLNEFAWDFSLRPPSRLSMMRHVRNGSQRAHVRALALDRRAAPAQAARAPSPAPRRSRQPDWAYQDIACQRCLESLRRGPGRKSK